MLKHQSDELSRRQFLQGVSIACCIGVPGISVQSLKAADYRVPSRYEEQPEEMISILAKALNATGKAECIREASRLETLPSPKTDFNLHLRQAGLKLQDALILAKALSALSGQSDMTLRSFSVSYNPELQDEGIVALIKALPPSLTEIGLVGCEMGDAAAVVFLASIENSFNLRMVCLEDNKLSEEMRGNFMALGHKRDNLLVVA